MIKSRAAIANLNEESDIWSEAHDELIQKFIEDPATKLIVAFQDSRLGFVVDQVVPPHPPDQIVYFIKTEKTNEVTYENFFKVVQYGTVKASHIESLLRIMMGVYAPIFFENTSWPDSILCHEYLLWRMLHFIYFSVPCTIAPHNKCNIKVKQIYSTYIDIINVIVIQCHNI